MLIDRFYAIAQALVGIGVVMLCQPFSFSIHVGAFPVLLAGVVMFFVLDHLPETGRDEESKP